MWSWVAVSEELSVEWLAGVSSNPRSSNHRILSFTARLIISMTQSSHPPKIINTIESTMPSTLSFCALFARRQRLDGTSHNKQMTILTALSSELYQSRYFLQNLSYFYLLLLFRKVLYHFDQYMSSFWRMINKFVLNDKNNRGIIYTFYCYCRARKTSGKERV